MSSSNSTTPDVAASPSIPPVQSLTAPYLFGSLFNWALFGILSVQCFVYFRYFPKDRLWMKLLVWFILIIEIVQTSLNGYDLYVWFGSGFGDVAGLARVNLSPIDIPLFAALTSLTVQLFFCYRIWGINRSFLPVCIFIALISLVQAICAFYGAVTAFEANNISEAEVNKRIVIVWLTGTAIADVMIAGIMTFLFLGIGDVAHRYSSDILAKIVTLTVETNAITATVAVIFLAVFLGIPNTGYFYTPSVVVGKLYSNTLLVTFNNRIALRQAAKRMPQRSSYSNNSGRVLVTGATNGSNSSSNQSNPSNGFSDTPTLTPTPFLFFPQLPTSEHEYGGSDTMDETTKVEPDSADLLRIQKVMPH